MTFRMDSNFFCYRFLRPSAFHQAIGQRDSTFNNYSQHDSQELISMVLETLHEDLMATNSR